MCRYQSVARVPENWTAAVASEMQDMWKMLDKMSADDPEVARSMLSDAGQKYHMSVLRRTRNSFRTR